MAGLGWENAARDARDRDRVCELAPVDFAAACGVASGIRLPWYRVQAISGLAGAAPESQVDAFLEQARGEAAKDDDAYRRCGVMAWVIDAAIARGRTVFARDVLRRAIEGSAEATPTRSRATALELLLKRAAVLGEREAREAGEALLDAAEVLLADPFKKWRGSAPCSTR